MKKLNHESMAAAAQRTRGDEITTDPVTAADDGKRFATLKAKAALMGIAIHQLADGGFLACRWNLSKDLPDADALSRWLFTMGVR